MLLKIILANAEPEVLGYLYDLGLSVELLFAKHMISNFSSLFMTELCLRIRDIYFILKFYPSVRRYPGKQSYKSRYRLLHDFQGMPDLIAS